LRRGRIGRGDPKPAAAQDRITADASRSPWKGHIHAMDLN